MKFLIIIYVRLNENGNEDCYSHVYLQRYKLSIVNG